MALISLLSSMDMLFANDCMKSERRVKYAPSGAMAYVHVYMQRKRSTAVLNI